MNDPPNIELQQRLQEAAELAEEERWDEAFHLLLDEESTYPDDPTLLCMLGVLALQVDSGMAYDFFRRCLSQQPDDPRLLVALGDGLARYDDPDAEGVLRLAAITAPELTEARLSYGAYLAREGLLDTALEELRAARAGDEEDARVARELGGAYLLAGDDRLGIEELERGTFLDPEDAELLLLFALACFRARRIAEGAEAVHRASLSLLEDGDVQLLTALACATQEWDGEAWEAIARAEGAEVPPDSVTLREAEEAISDGPADAEAFLLEQIAAPMLRTRLLERS